MHFSWQAVKSDAAIAHEMDCLKTRSSYPQVATECRPASLHNGTVQYHLKVQLFSVCSLALCSSPRLIIECPFPCSLLFQSGISIDTTGTTHLAGYSCTTGLRCGSIEVSSRGGLEKILSENLQEMFPYSCKKGHVPRRKSQKSFRIPNHPEIKSRKLRLLSMLL